MHSLVPRFSIDRGDLFRRLRLLQGDIGRINKILQSQNSPEAASVSNWQTRFALLEDQYRSLSLNLYLYGYSLELVRSALACAGLASSRVFERRGTEAPFPVMDVTIDTRYPQGDSRRVIETGRHPLGSKDHSKTNSRANFKGVCEALAGGKILLAGHIAALAWDPPDAEWLTMNSVTCTPNDQHLAYAVKFFFADDLVQMQSELKRIHPRPRKDIEIAYIAGMLEAIVARNEVQFREWLGDLLDWHEREAKSDDPILDSELCLPGIAFSTLAVKRGVIAISELPEGNVYLPVELIALSQTGERGESNFQFETFDSLEIIADGS